VSPGRSENRRVPQGDFITVIEGYRICHHERDHESIPYAAAR
jgi:hypothetical protein